MSVYTIRPLEDRTGFKGHPKRSPFTTRVGDSYRRQPIPFGQTRELLARELKMLKATNVILEVDVLPSRIRLDGELYADARTNSPAVRLHFDSEHGHLTYATDAFTTWQDNVRAIALALEALRKVDRFEVGQGGDQYRGYLALEAGSGATALGATPRMTHSEAAVAIWEALGMPARPTPAAIGSVPDTRRSAVRQARALAHPDRNAGERTQWDRVEQAAKVLGLA